MAQVMFVEHQGQRIDITDAERIVETKCDQCQQYVARDQAVSVTLSITAAGRQPVHFYAEGHAGHAGTMTGEAVAAWIAANAQS